MPIWVWHYGTLDLGATTAAAVQQYRPSYVCPLQGQWPNLLGMLQITLVVAP